MYFLVFVVLLVCLWSAAWAGAVLYEHWDDASAEARVERREATLGLFRALIVFPFVIIASVFNETWGREILMLMFGLFGVWFLLWRRYRVAKRLVRDEQSALQPPLRQPRSPRPSYAEEVAGVWEVEDQQYVLTLTEDRRWVQVSSPEGSNTVPEWVIRHGRKLDASSR